MDTNEKKMAQNTLLANDMGSKEKQGTQNPTPVLNLLSKRTETVLFWVCLRHSIICHYSLMFFHAFQLKQGNWITLSFLCLFHLL